MTSDLPQFSQCEPAQFPLELQQLLESSLQQIEQHIQQATEPSWHTFMTEIEEIESRVDARWSMMSHLHAVNSEADIRTAYMDCLPHLSAYSTSLSHNLGYYAVMQQLAQRGDLDRAQRAVVTQAIRDFRLAGVALDEQAKAQYAATVAELSELTSQFEQNVLDATEAWAFHVEDEQRLEGLPESAVELAKQAAQARSWSGWALTLDAPAYLSVMTYCHDREIRQQLYRAYCTRASDQGPCAGQFDNSQLMVSICEKRLACARLLGYPHYAAYSLETKMMDNCEQVLAFLNQLVAASKEKAQREWQEIVSYAQEVCGLSTCELWDVAYISELMRQSKFSLSQEALRPYFPQEKVLNGLFDCLHQLFAIRFVEVTDVDVWHPEVSCYSVVDMDGQRVATIYFDLYAREKKRGGAWMDDCRSRRVDAEGKIHSPIAFVTCNFNRPTKDKPALFTHDEVVTLFHEVGHALQHCLTRVNHAAVSGINGVPWDAVEVASQFLENWAWQAESLALISGHYVSGEPLPDDLLRQMLAAKHFQSGMQTVRQCEFALFDFLLHMQTEPVTADQIQVLLNDVRQKTAVVPALPENRFQHAFSHIFAGGYAAGYYSYKWAEVMACDAFSVFIQNGIFDKDTSERFCRTFLQSGGVEPPLKLFHDFCGRSPGIEALLQATGIADE